MSYLGYPPYQQTPEMSQSGGYPPYSTGGAPYRTSNLPYPTKGEFPPSLGHPPNPPMYKPQPGYGVPCASAGHPAGTPQPTYPAGATQPTYLAGAPQPKYPASVPQLTYLASAPQLTYPAGVPQPTYLAGAPQPKYPAGAPQPTYLAGAPQSKYPAGATQPTYLAGAPQLKYPASAPQSPCPGSGAQTYAGSTSHSGYPTMLTIPPQHASDAAGQQGYSGSQGSGYESHLHGGGGCASHSGNYGCSTPSVLLTKTPTVVPANSFNAEADAKILRKAIKSYDIDKKAIIDVLCHRSNAQRMEIAVQYKAMHGKDLIKVFKNELDSSFGDTLVAMITPLPQYYATQLKKAVSGWGTDDDCLIEVLCTLSNEEIRTICAAYQSLYNKPLESDLRSNTDGHFKRLMTILCCARRDESGIIDQAQATADAEQLLQSGSLKWEIDDESAFNLILALCWAEPVSGLINQAQSVAGQVLEAGAPQWKIDKSTFNMILCQRSYKQLNLVFDEYERISGNDIENVVKEEFYGDIQQGLLAIIRAVRNLPGFFAKRLYQSMSGMDTRNSQLIRIIVTRCEIDMDEIKQNYAAKYGKTLANAIAKNVSGNYKKCLLALIGEH